MDANSATLDRVGSRALAAGAIGAVCCLACFAFRPEAFFRGYLVAYLYCLGIVLGGLPLAMLYRLTGGGWGALIQRPLVAAARVLPLAAVFFLPILGGLQNLYPWVERSRAGAAGPKGIYLNVPSFTVRAAVYFVVWIGLAHFLDRWSRRADFENEPAAARRLGILSGPGLVLFALTDTFAAVDWQMSLEPNWYSTIFPVIYALGQALAGLALAILATAVLAPHPELREPEGKSYLQDLGSLLMAFVMLWAYVSFSQFLLIWSGNLPEEIRWYLPRFAGGWQGIGILLVLCQFALPFLLLLSRELKRNPQQLGTVAGLILGMTFLDVLWQVMPAFPPEGMAAHALDIAAALAATLGIGGLLLAAFMRQLKLLPPPPLADPVTSEGQAHG